jgi:DNA (cytosine-5)-methyltransferase 1
VPQSRPRLFLLGIRSDLAIPKALRDTTPNDLWHSKAVAHAHSQLSDVVKETWVWWRLPKPAQRTSTFADLVESDPDSVRWHTPAETRKLLAMMSPINLAKVETAKRSGNRLVGTVYKRTRPDADGQKMQRAEIRFDDVAGCLRTPAGGSSRQVILVVEGDVVRSRLISSRETARLMGLPDTYHLPAKYNDAYHLTGDGVVVPVVAHLSRHLLEPLLRSNAQCAADRTTLSEALAPKSLYCRIELEQAGREPSLRAASPPLNPLLTSPRHAQATNRPLPSRSCHAPLPDRR